MNYLEMRQLSQSPPAVRSAARQVRAALGHSITEAEADFLQKLETFSDRDQLSTRQGEFLWVLRERSSRSSKQGGYSADTLVRLLWEARYDLSCEDEERLGALVTRGSALKLSNSQWRWILALCREINLIEDEYIELK